MIVALDVSNSMAATDVAPTRLKAAQQAANAFIDAQPDSVDIGVVAFQNGALTTSQPSADHEAAKAAVDRLRVSGGTSLAAAILTSLSAITGKKVAVGRDGTVPDIGYWASATIVVFSDGEDRGSGDALEAAAAAAQGAGVHIQTVGVGTTAGTTVEVDGYRVRTALDEATLTALAETTGGSYHPASDAAELDRIASTIDLRLTTQPRGPAAGRGVRRVRRPAAGGRSGPHRPAHGKAGLMSFAWPWALSALLAIPLVLGVAWWSRRRRRRAAVRVTSAALVRAALPGRSRWRRRIPAALLVLGLAVLGVGAARPQATVAVPSSSTTILLALDVSRSMCSTDVSPNRLTAAQEAAAAFIKAQPGGSRIGLVAFAGVAGVIVPPTDDTDKLLAALPTLTTSRGTAIGQAILTSIDAIAEIDPSVSPTGVDVDSGGGGTAYVPHTIVVLTDGANTQGVDPQIAAKEAADRRLRVYTISFGTTTPAPTVCDSSQVDDGSGGGPGGFGGRRPRPRRPQPAGRRRGDPQAGRRHHRRQLLPRGERRPAAERPGRPAPRHLRHARAPRHRQLVLRCRRAAGRHRDRAVPVVEPGTPRHRAHGPAVPARPPTLPARPALRRRGDGKESWHRHRTPMVGEDESVGRSGGRGPGSLDVGGVGGALPARASATRATLDRP